MTYINNLLEDISNIKIGNISLFNVIKVLILAILLYFVIKYIIKLTQKLLSKTTLDKTIQHVIIGVCRFALYFFAGTILAEQVGIPTTSFIAILGTMGLAFSLAMQDSLANIAGGMLLLYTKPFFTNDYIEADGVSGTVEKIGFIHTSLFTVDNKKIFIPNGKLSKERITNFSSEPKRQLEIIFPVSYGVDTKLAKSIIERSLAECPFIDHERVIFVRVWNLSESSVDIICRAWADSGNFMEAKCALLETVKDAFDKAGFVIPYRHINVDLKNTEV